jgi:hypothetical protein
MPPVGFEPAIPASAGPQTYALDRAATGIGTMGKNVAVSEGKAVGTWNCPLTPSKTLVKNDWSYTFTSPFTFSA